MSRIIKVIVFWIIGLFVISYIGSAAFPKISNSSLGARTETRNFNYYLSLAQWDGGNYLDIAKNGYHKINYYAFSPAYPFAVMLTTKITPFDFVTSGVLLSASYLLLFLYFFYRYTKDLFTEKVAQSVLLTFIFFPATFYCLLIYSESMFLFLEILFLYTFSRKNYIWAFLSLAILPLVRFLGIFMILSSLIRNLRVDKNLKLTLATLMSSSPFVIYCAIIFSIFHNPLYFVSTQSLWSRFILDPVTTLFQYFVPLLSLKAISFNNLLDLSVTILFVALLILGVKKLPLNLWLFSAFSILIPASTGTLNGMPRYALLSLGAFIILGKILSERPKLKLFIWPFSLALQCLFFSLFITGHWIA